MQFNRKKLIIIGAGSLGILTLDAILSNSLFKKENICFLDDNIEKDILIYGCRVIGKVDSIKRLNVEKYAFVIAIANNKVRKRIAEKYSDLFYTNVIHPDATISRNAKLGNGNIILSNTSIDPKVTIENHVIINKNVSIGHDSKLKSYSQISPGCNLGGHTNINTGAFLGLGTNILPNVSIGDFSVIGAGSTVINNINKNCTAVGTPCKIIKKNI